MAKRPNKKRGPSRADRTPQFNFRVAPELDAAIREWCAGHLVDHAVAMRVGFYMLATMSPDQRKKMIAAYREWEKSGYDIGELSDL